MIAIRRPGSCLFTTLLVAAPLAASAQVVPPPQPIPAQRFTTEVAGGNVQVAPPVTTTVTATTAPVTQASTIGSHQIDRFEAIRQLQADLASDANNVANWTILGELAHEVALDVPQGQDDAYYTLSRQAYERAAQLEPANQGLRSAVQFAREQEANAAAFDARRRQGVATYLEARRREMTVNGVNPTVLVYESSAPVVGQPVVGAPVVTYPTPTYRPYYNPQAQQALGYNQYSNGYSLPTTTGVAPVAPTTLRQFGQQLPGVIIREGARSIGR